VIRASASATTAAANVPWKCQAARVGPRNLPLIFDTFAPGYVHAACMYLGYILYIDRVYCFIAQALRSNAGIVNVTSSVAATAVRSPDLGKVT